MPDIFELLKCPTCGGSLERDGGSLICRGGAKTHTFDVARQGYVNMLPPGRGRNAKSGDDAEMVRSRSAFLSLGYYDRISDTVADLILEYYPTEETGGIIKIADSGCGEGYHTCRFVKRISETGMTPVCCAAFDASKNAAAHAAKSAAEQALAPKNGIGAPFEGSSLISFMTGNIFYLPLKDKSVGAVVSMFAPIAGDENFRILTHGGITVVAASGEDHLIEMREMIYPNVIKKPSVPKAGDGFYQADCKNLKYKIKLESNSSIMNLFGMTPFCYKTPPNAVKILEKTDLLELTVDTDLYVFIKK